jgi:ribose transport system permease protein
MDMHKIIDRLKAIPPVLWIIVFMMLVFSLISNRYMTFNNMLNTAQQGAVLLIVASAATIVILSEGLDLSLGGVLTIAGVTAVMTVNAKLPVPLAFLVGIATGAACGACTGLLVAFFRMPPFIATLGMQGILFGLALVLTNSTGIFTGNQAFTFFGGKAAGFIPMAAVCAGLVFFLTWFVLHHTRFGRYVIAIGGNEAGTHLSGVNTVFWKWMVYTFAGLVAGFGGVVLAARLEVADPIVGMGWEFDAIAAVILGGTSFQKGRGDVSGTIVGVLLITVLRNGLNVIGTPSIMQPALIGTILILAIVFQVWMSIRSERVKI